jgi:addiction module RelE/StbE family toxin
MKIVFKKSFVKQYAKLNKRSRNAVNDAIQLFELNPLNPQLKNHALKGKLRGKRAFSAGFDLRVIFKIEGEYVTVEMLGVGTHNQVY